MIISLSLFGVFSFNILEKKRDPKVPIYFYVSCINRC